MAQIHIQRVMNGSDSWDSLNRSLPFHGTCHVFYHFLCKIGGLGRTGILQGGLPYRSVGRSIRLSIPTMDGSKRTTRSAALQPLLCRLHYRIFEFGLNSSNYQVLLEQRHVLLQEIGDPIVQGCMVGILPYSPVGAGVHQQYRIPESTAPESSLPHIRFSFELVIVFHLFILILWFSLSC